MLVTASVEEVLTWEISHGFNFFIVVVEGEATDRLGLRGRKYRPHGPSGAHCEFRWRTCCGVNNLKLLFITSFSPPDLRQVEAESRIRGFERTYNCSHCVIAICILCIVQLQTLSTN